MHGPPHGGIRGPANAIGERATSPTRNPKSAPFERLSIDVFIIAAFTPPPRGLVKPLIKKNKRILGRETPQAESMGTLVKEEQRTPVPNCMAILRMRSTRRVAHLRADRE